MRPEQVRFDHYFQLDIFQWTSLEQEDVQYQSAIRPGAG